MIDSPAQPSSGSPQVRYVYGRLMENVGSRAERLAREEVVKAKRIARDARAKEQNPNLNSLVKMAETKILKDLNYSLETHARAATFACGGSVPFKGAAAEATGEKIKDPTEQQANTMNLPKANSAAVDDVQVRFGDSGSGVTVNFNMDGTSLANFEHLLKACQPASFGRANEKQYLTRSTARLGSSIVRNSPRPFVRMRLVSSMPSPNFSCHSTSMANIAAV